MGAASVGAEAALLWVDVCLGAAHLVNSSLNVGEVPTNSGVFFPFGMPMSTWTRGLVLGNLYPAPARKTHRTTYRPMSPRPFVRDMRACFAEKCRATIKVRQRSYPDCRAIEQGVLGIELEPQISALGRKCHNHLTRSFPNAVPIGTVVAGRGHPPHSLILDERSMTVSLTTAPGPRTPTRPSHLPRLRLDERLSTCGEWEQCVRVRDAAWAPYS